MSDITFLSWSRDHIPPSYERISWEEKRERLPSDYGIAEGSCVSKEYIFTDWERSKEHDLAITF